MRCRTASSIEALWDPCWLMRQSSGRYARSTMARGIITSSVTIRHTIEHRAARPARVARIFHRHHAAAFADEHAGPDDDRRLVADDDARMRRGQARSGAVGPDDCISCEDAAPAIIATDIDALTGAGLRHRGGGRARDQRRYQDGE